MIKDLILHEATKSQLLQFRAAPSHAVLLTGADGIGKMAIAQALAEELLGLSEGKLASHPHYLWLRPDGASISIESVRQLQKFLQLKTAGTNPLRRAIIIESAHSLTTEAQNAYLKLLEEPPADTLMILTASSPRALLPTILSRLQTISVHAPTEEQLQPLFAASSKDEATKRQAYFLSGGMPGLLSALLRNDETHPLLASVAVAKEILQKSPFERLALAESLAKQKDAALGAVEALERIAQSGLATAGTRGDAAKVRQWHRVRKLALEARDALGKSANTKLTLSNLFLHL